MNTYQILIGIIGVILIVGWRHSMKKIVIPACPKLNTPTEIAFVMGVITFIIGGTQDPFIFYTLDFTTRWSLGSGLLFILIVSIIGKWCYLSKHK